MALAIPQSPPSCEIYNYVIVIYLKMTFVAATVGPIFCLLNVI